MAKKKKAAGDIRGLSRSGPKPRITVTVGSLGRESHGLDVNAGATVKDVAVMLGISDLRDVRIYVNGQTARASTKLNDRDVVVVVPAAIEGGAARFDHLDMTRYQREMAPSDYEFFTRFVGADVLGIEGTDLGR